MCFYRIKEKLRSGEFSVAGDQWPIFLYRSYQYDERDPWKGLLQSQILIKVGAVSSTLIFINIGLTDLCL